jgi:hypothetical protein
MFFTPELFQKAKILTYSFIEREVIGVYFFISNHTEFVDNNPNGIRIFLKQCNTPKNNKSGRTRFCLG